MKLDIDKAIQVWEEYVRTHDLSGKENLAVGIDPDTGDVRFAESAKAITLRLIDEGCNKPLYFRWVKNPIYRARDMLDDRVRQFREYAGSTIADRAADLDGRP